VARQQATYFASIVESAMQSYFSLHQDMAPPPKVNTYPEVDL